MSFWVYCAMDEGWWMKDEGLFVSMFNKKTPHASQRRVLTKIKLTSFYLTN